MKINKKLIKICEQHNIPLLQKLSVLYPERDITPVEELYILIDAEDLYFAKLERSRDMSGYYEWLGSDEVKELRKDYLRQQRKDLYEDYKVATGAEKLALEERIKKSVLVERGKVVTDEMIRQAKQYPIENMLGRDVGGKYKCISGLHVDNNPSLHYYKKTNTCYCFTCQTKFDSIDVYMRVHGCSFREAVLTLSGGGV